MKRNLRILCISPSFVPNADSEAYCGGKIISEIKKRGHHVSILTHGQNIYPNRTYDTSKLWEHVKEDTVLLEQPQDSTFSSKLMNIIKYSTITWARWVNEVVKKSVILNREAQYDIVYSRSLPMIAHVAGYWCSNTLNVPWIVNINDPWDMNLFPDKQVDVAWIEAQYSKRWLKKTIRHSSVITYPCERLWKFHEKISGIKHSGKIIPHIGYKTETSQISNNFCLVHAGKLGANEMSGRPTNAIIEGMAEFFRTIPEAKGKTKLILVGQNDELTQKLARLHKVDDNVETVGRVSYEESLKYISGASICLLVEGNMNDGIYLPSKIADYIVANKPILAISPREGTINDMLPNKGLIRVDQDDAIGVATALAKYHRHYCNNTLNERSPSDALINQFMPDTVVNQFLSAVNEVIGKRAN
jgi:hypothetical protein